MKDAKSDTAPTQVPLTPHATGGMQTLQPPRGLDFAGTPRRLTTRLRLPIIPGNRAAPRWPRPRPCRDMIDVFLVHDDVERCTAIRNAIKTNPELNLVSETQTAREGLFAAATMLTGHPRLLIVRLNLGDMTGFRLHQPGPAEGARYLRHPALEGTEGGQVWQNLLQLELRDVLVGPIPAPEIAKVLNTAGPRAQERFDQHRAPTGIEGEAFVITVVSARGGTGKSVIATNLAAAMGKLSDSVALLDFSLNPRRLRRDARRRSARQRHERGAAGRRARRGVSQQHAGDAPRLRFRYLASPNQEFDAATFDYNVAAAIMTATRTLSQYIIVDTGIAMAGPTIAAIDSSDIIFLVTSRDVARLLSAKSFIKYLKNDGRSPTKSSRSWSTRPRSAPRFPRARSSRSWSTRSRPIYRATQRRSPSRSTAARRLSCPSRTTRFPLCSTSSPSSPSIAGRRNRATTKVEKSGPEGFGADGFEVMWPVLC